MSRMRTEEEDLPTIGLSIIVKDEEEVIERMLESVAPLLDYYTVVDTGSTDRTKEIIKDFFEEKDIPGDIIDYPFTNFEDCRNKALKEAKDKADYSMTIDADEQVIYDDPNFSAETFKLNLSNHDLVSLSIQYGDMTYSRPHFWKNDKPFRWEGPVHEYLVPEEPNISHGIAEGMHILVKPEGASWQQSMNEKYEEHARLLEEYINASEENYKPRWVFYLAQSYKDAASGVDDETAKKNIEKAIERYRERVQMRDRDDSFFEEAYYSQFMVAHCYQKLNKSVGEVLDEYAKCTELDRKRAEHFLHMIMILHQLGRMEYAYSIGTYAIKYHNKNPHPHRFLFIDHATYDYKIADLHSISAYYTGRMDEAKKTFRWILKKLRKGQLQLSEPEAKRIEKNKRFLS